MTKIRAIIFEPDQVVEVDVVGESHYQDALERLGGGRTTDGCVITDQLVVLVPQPDNPWDKNAIRVSIDGETVGYLSRDDAKRYAKVIGRCRSMDGFASARAILTGGWGRGGDDRGHIGVRLALGTPASMLAELATIEGLPDHGEAASGGDDADRLLADAVAIISEYDRASASLLQRRMKIGYAQAARIIDQLEARGYIAPFDGSIARQVRRRE